MIHSIVPRTKFYIGLSIVGVIFVYTQLWRTFRIPFVRDEIEGALSVFRLTREIPYCDFTPYKTVIGYYIQLPTLLVATDAWNGLILMRLQLVAINIIFLFYLSRYLYRQYSAVAMLGALLVLVSNVNFYIHASSIRVDMLTAIAGFYALLLLLSGKYFWSGFLCAASFFISQKGAYYIISQIVACGLMFLYMPPIEALKRRFLPMIAGMGCTTLAYGIFWAPCFRVSLLVEKVFIKHADKAFGDVYRESLNFLEFWYLALQANWFYYLLFFTGLLHLFLDRRESNVREETLLFGYSATLMFLSVNHAQPWPYFFVIFLPTSTLVIARFIEYSLKSIRHMSVRTRTLFALVFLFYAGYPLYFMSFFENVSYIEAQKKIIYFLEQDLGEDENYIGPTSYLYTRRQPIPIMSSLDSPRIFRLNELSDSELDGLIHKIRESKVKYFLLNNRSTGLPERLREFIDQNYKQLWHMLHSYAPSVTAADSTLTIEFSGEYRVISDERIAVDGVEYSDGDVLQLTQGEVPVIGQFRIQLLPSNHRKLLPGSPLTNDEIYELR